LGITISGLDTEREDVENRSKWKKVLGNALFDEEEEGRNSGKKRRMKERLAGHLRFGQSLIPTNQEDARCLSKICRRDVVRV